MDQNIFCCRNFDSSYELRSETGKKLMLLVTTDHFRRAYSVVFFVVSEAPDSGPFYRQVVEDILRHGRVPLP